MRFTKKIRGKTSRKDFAEKLGVSRQHLSYLEAAGERLTAELFIRYFELSGLSPDRYLSLVRSEPAARSKTRK